MEYENKYASRGIGGTALGLSIGALGAEFLGGRLGNILGGNGGCGDNATVSRYELGLQQELAAKDSRIGLLESNIYTDSKIADVYERLNNKISGIEAQVCQQAVINAQVTANLSCMQNTINVLQGLTKSVIPVDSICPQVMPQYNSWTAPTSTT